MINMVAPTQDARKWVCTSEGCRFPRWIPNRSIESGEKPTCIYCNHPLELARERVVYGNIRTLRIL